MEGYPTDQCGFYVSISDSVAVMGCPSPPGKNDRPTRFGSAVVFEFIGSEWTETARLAPDDPVSNALFGSSVSTDGNTIVVGAQFRSVTASGDGAAYVFERNNGDTGEWKQVSRLLASDATASDFFGREVAVLGSTAVVASLAADGAGQDEGAVYVFERTESGWSETFKLQALDPSPGALFGSSIAIGENRIVVGASVAQDDNEVETGVSYVFEFDATLGEWVQIAKLLANDGDAGDFFGGSVDVWENTIAVSASGDDDRGSDFGAVYIFEQTDGVWHQSTKITTENSCSGTCFGADVALEGNVLLVGAPQLPTSTGEVVGATFVLKKVGSSWNDEVRLVAAEGLSMGESVDMSGGKILAGAPSRNPERGTIVALQGIAFLAKADSIGECQQQISGFNVVDPSTSLKAPLRGVVDLFHSQSPLRNIEAVAESCGRPLPLIRVSLSGVFSSLEREPPFDLFGEPSLLPRGLQNVEACFCEDGASCDVRTGCLDVDIFVDGTCQPEITEIIAYDALTDKPLETLTSEAQVCIPESREMNFEAITSCVSALTLSLDGEGRRDVRRESAAPYFLYGDVGSDVLRQYGSPMAAGEYTIRARYIPDIATTTNRRQTLRIDFSLIDCTPPSLAPFESPSTTASLNPVPASSQTPTHKEVAAPPSMPVPTETHAPAQIPT